MYLSCSSYDIGERVRVYICACISIVQDGLDTLNLVVVFFFKKIIFITNYEGLLLVNLGNIFTIY